MDAQQEAVAAARLKLKSKMGTTQTGGKGSMRRKKKVAPKNKNDDAALTKKLSKFGLQQLPDIEEVNMFREDDSVLHFKRPTLQFSMKEQLVTVSGETEEKNIKDLLPGILSQVGPDQYKALQEIVGQAAPGKTDEKDDDDVPELVGGNFEDAAKK